MSHIFAQYVAESFARFCLAHVERLRRVVADAHDQVAHGRVVLIRCAGQLVARGPQSALRRGCRGRGLGNLALGGHGAHPDLPPDG